METLDIQTIIQGGAVGLALALIIYSWQKDKLYNKTMNNHLKHLNSTLGELSGNIKDNTRQTVNNQRVMERVERILDKQ